MQYQTLCSRSAMLLMAAAGATSMAQSHVTLDDSIRDVVRAFPGHEPAFYIQDEIIAGLPYDGVSIHSNKAQVFEDIWEPYDIFVIEDIEPMADASLTVFRSDGFGNGDPGRIEDFVVRVFENNGTGLPGQDGYTGVMVMRSVPGAGFFDLDTRDFVTDFEGQCLSAGSYYLVWYVRLNFDCCGQVFFFQQEGEPIAGGGEANNAWQWNPGGAYGLGTHFTVRDEFGQGDRRGVNYLLFGTPADCSPTCSNPDCPADLDGDNDTDADDFFAYLDLFVQGC